MLDLSPNTETDLISAQVNSAFSTDKPYTPDWPRQASLVIDGMGSRLHIDPMTSEILAQRDGIGLVNDRLSFSDDVAAHRYGKALRRIEASRGNGSDAAARKFSARRPSGKRPYLVRIGALSGGEWNFNAEAISEAVIVIRDPSLFVQLDTDLLRQSYGLSIAETELASALDRSLTLRAVATERNVSITTIRSQLYTLMAKLAVNRQSDLIRLLANYRQPFL